MPAKEKIIFGFKILSIFLISLIIVYFLGSLNNQEMTNLITKKETQTIIKPIYTPKIYSFCENDSDKSAELTKNSFAYYSFAVILGAFINSKKIMKIGVI
jgi:hypothetical protein